jgi:monoamine oxidase
MKSKRERILIIGAGASGLMAAARLSSYSDVTILEARNRAGGRIFPVGEKLDFPAEAGAEFVHGQQPLTQELLKKTASTTHLFDGRVFKKENGSISNDHGMFDEHWDELMESLKELDSDQPIGEVLRNQFAGAKYRTLRKTVEQFAEGYDAADLNRVSAFALREEWSHQDDDDQLRIGGGYLQVIDHLKHQVERNGGKVVLSAAVSAINWAPGAVEVTTTDGRTYNGERILVTVPLGVLQHGAIAFSPKLTDHEKAFSQLGFGGVIKFLFQFTPEFWRQTVQTKFPGFSFIFSDARIPTWWSQAPSEDPLITGWLSGPTAVSIGKDPHFLYEAAIESLSYLLDVSRDTLMASIAKWHIADWVSDPFARGAYAFATVGSRKHIEFLQVPIHSTIYFAGEALYIGDAMGTVEAALQSGRDAAKKIHSD